jgi:hypothetical protein
MRKILLAAAAATTLAAVSLPASAQVYFGGDRGGVEFGFRGDHDRDRGDRDRGWHDYGYARDCRLTRERFVTPSGRVIYRTHRDCD